MRNIKGFNILLDLHGCPIENLEKVSSLKEIITKAGEKAGFTIIGEKFHQFEPRGVTGIVLLASSHISVHTWPEFNFVAVDIYSCKGKEAAKKSAKYLIEFFKPKNYEIKEVERYR